MGWTEGTGLGKRRDGNVTHIRIQQREEEAGLGKEKDGIKGVGDVWWKESVGGTLARLQSKKGKKSKSKDKDKKSKDKEKSAAKTFTDQELFIATNGARFGMRAQRRAEGKWKRTESGQTLEELEKKAKKSMEWNGRGEARLVSREGDRKRRRDDEEVAVDGDVDNATITEVAESEKKRLKKLRKQEKKREKAHKVSSDEDVVETKDEKKKKKKMKSKR